MIHFHYPLAFYLLIPFAMLAGLYVWSRWKRLRDLHRLGDWRLVKELVPIDAILRRRLKDRLALIGLFLAIFAAAGIQWGAKLKEVKQRGVDVFIALDTSRSMLAEDVVPTRLDKAKRSLGLLIDKLAGNRIGIIAFAKRSLIQCPLTVDTDAARMFLEILDQNTIPEQGTSLGDAIRTALAGFSKDDKTGRAIVLLTDGEDHSSDPMGAAKEAKEAGVVIFTIGIGTPKGEVIKDRDESGKITEFHKFKGEMVMSRLDDGLLTEMATLTGGRYYRASSTDKEIDEISEILSEYDKKDFSAKIFEQLQERYQIFLLIAILILIFEFFFAERPGQWGRVIEGTQKGIETLQQKRKAPVSALLFLSAILAASVASADVKSHVRAGNKLLKKGDIAGARAEFESAQIDAPEAPYLPYNIAATYLMEGNFDEAKRQYERAAGMTTNVDLKSKVAYNLGHVYFYSGDREKAIEKFKECLKLNPNDMDAKYNIEYLKAGKNPKSPPPQQKPSPGKNDQKKEGDQDKNQDNKGEGQKEGEKDGQQKENQPKPGELSKENAERILQMMNDQEKEKLKNGQAQKVGVYGKKDKKEADTGEDW